RPSIERFRSQAAGAPFGWRSRIRRRRTPQRRTARRPFLNISEINISNFKKGCHKQPFCLAKDLRLNQFEQFDLPPGLMQSLATMKFVTPTPIQAKAIPVGLTGRDVLGLAQTGTGKTGAFGIPVIVNLLKNPGKCALVLAPTRELAMQIDQVL